MPLYDYKCEKCGEKFEVRQWFWQNGSKLKCPECGELNPRKLITDCSPANSNESTENGQVCYVPKKGG